MSSQLPPARPCILVVEDEWLVADMIEEMAVSLGYEVSAIARDLVSARNELAKRNFDAVLLDITLDGRRCTEIADWLLEVGVPFAFVSGYDRPLEPRHASVPLLSKPFVIEQLAALLNELVGSGDRQDELSRVG